MDETMLKKREKINIPVFGLVIQGPILSRGRTGLTANIRGSKVEEKDVVDYDCTNNVAHIYEKYSNVFRRIIVATWDTEDIAMLTQLINEADILQIKDNTRYLKPRSEIITRNNKYRQFLSMKKGLEVLKVSGCNLSIKIRSDQSLDLGLLCSYISKLYKDNPHDGRIVVPCFNRDYRSHINDFYFGGQTEILLKACNYYLSGIEFASSVHTDLFYKLTWTMSSCNGKVPLVSHLPSDKKQPQTDILLNAWKDVFVPGPEEVFQSVIWRGETLLKNTNNYVFADDFNKYFQELIDLSQNNKTVIPSILSSDILTLSNLVLGYKPKYVLLIVRGFSLFRKGLNIIRKLFNLKSRKIH